jgi:hypothetical protein
MKYITLTFSEKHALLTVPPHFFSGEKSQDHISQPKRYTRKGNDSKTPLWSIQSTSLATLSLIQLLMAITQ